MRVDFDTAEVQRNLQRVAAEMRTRIVDEAVEQAAKKLVELVAKHPNVPRSGIPGGSKGKGHAADNFIYEQQELGLYLVGVGPDHFYLRFHETGAGSATGKTPSGRNYKTPATPAKPFMRPTLENNKEALQGEMAKIIRRELGLR